MNQTRRTTGPEQSIWVTHPSSLAYFPTLLIAIVGGWYLTRYTGIAAQMLISATQGTLPWTQAWADNVIRFSPLVAFLPALFIFLKMVSLRFTTYELTNQRLKVDTGMIMRKHDEIDLHLVRDQIVSRPLMGIFFGYGTIRLLTDDRSMGNLTMSFVPAAKDKSEVMRTHVLAWKDKIGFREFHNESSMS